MIREKLDEWSQYSEAVDMIASTFDTLAKECGIEDREMEAVTDEWINVKAHACDRRKAIDRKIRSQNVVYEIFGRSKIENDFKLLDNVGSATWKAFSAFAVVCDRHKLCYRDAMLYVLQGQIERLKLVRTRKTDIPQPSDFDFARQMILDGKHVPVMDELVDQISAAGYHLGLNRLVSFDPNLAITYNDGEMGGGGDDDVVEAVPESPKADVLPSGLVNRAGLQINLDQIDALGDRIDMEASRHGQDIVPEYDVDYDLESAVGDKYDPSSDDESDIDEEVNEEDDGYCSDYSATVRATKKRKKMIQGKIGKRSCMCDETISSHLLHHCSEKNGELTDSAQVALINMWRINRKRGEICWSHTVWIAAHVGFKVHSLDQAGLEKLPNTYHDHALNGTLGNFKTDQETYTLFRRGSRPVHPEDGLGPYKFFHNQTPKVSFTKDDQLQLRKELGIDSASWEKDGSIIMDGMSWWKQVSVDLNGEKKVIYDVVNEEFAMYDYHLRRINDKSNFGWCRTMFHSTVQQVMRQDPWYFLIYCALRGDLCTWLISYPYYTKFAAKDDSTYFRHIDLNLPRLLANKRGYFQIQGSLSIDDENEDGCTEILPGMHKHMTEWYELLVQRGARLGDYVHRVDNKMFTPEDAERWGTDWIATRCKSLQVRITDPGIPHGAQGACKRTRRTMLPWYVGIQDDHRALEVIECGTWEQLAAAHRNLTSGPASPSGLANRYGDIPYAFPAAVHLTGLGPISDALVGRIRHDNPSVVFLKQKLLTGGADFRANYLNQWRQEATRAVIHAFEQCRAAEKICFGDKSYFYRLENGLSLDVVSDVDANPTYESGGGHGGEFDDDADNRARLEIGDDGLDMDERENALACNKDDASAMNLDREDINSLGSDIALS